MDFLTLIIHGHFPDSRFKHLFTLCLETSPGKFRPVVLTHGHPQVSLLDVIPLVTFSSCLLVFCSVADCVLTWEFWLYLHVKL